MSNKNAENALIARNSLSIQKKLSFRFALLLLLMNVFWLVAKRVDSRPGNNFFNDCLGFLSLGLASGMWLFLHFIPKFPELIPGDFLQEAESNSIFQEKIIARTLGVSCFFAFVSSCAHFSEGDSSRGIFSAFLLFFPLRITMRELVQQAKENHLWQQEFGQSLIARLDDQLRQFRRGPLTLSKMISVEANILGIILHFPPRHREALIRHFNELGVLLVHREAESHFSLPMSSLSHPSFSGEDLSVSLDFDGLLDKLRPRR